MDPLPEGTDVSLKNRPWPALLRKERLDRTWRGGTDLIRDAWDSWRSPSSDDTLDGVLEMLEDRVDLREPVVETGEDIGGGVSRE